MKTDFMTAMKMVKEDKNLYAEESVNGLEMYKVNDDVSVFAAEFQGGDEIYDIPLASIMTEWTIYAPLGYRVERVGADRCYNLPGAKPIKSVVSEQESKSIKEDAERIERNKKLVPNAVKTTIAVVFKSGNCIPYNSDETLEQIVKNGKDPLYPNCSRILEIWVGGKYGELVYTDKDGFI